MLKLYSCSRKRKEKTKNKTKKQKKKQKKLKCSNKSIFLKEVNIIKNCLLNKSKNPENFKKNHNS